MIRTQPTALGAIVAAAFAAPVYAADGALTEASPAIGHYSFELFRIPPLMTETLLTLRGEFDTYLLVIEPGGEVLQNNDHGFGQTDLGQTDSAVLLPPGEERVVIATSYYLGETGTFQLDANGVEIVSLDRAEVNFGRIEQAFARRPSEASMPRGLIDESTNSFVVEYRPLLSREGMAEAEADVQVSEDGQASENNYSAAEAQAVLPPPDVDVQVPGSDVSVAPGTPTITVDQIAPEIELEQPMLDQLFPWPPPNATDRMVLPRSFFDEVETLGEVADVVTQALSEAGYPSSTGFWAIEGSGFAAVTRMEQTDGSGGPLEGSLRFAEEIAWIKRWSLAGILRAMATTEPGFYRTIALLVTDLPFSEVPRSEAITQRIVGHWSDGGLNVLPRAYTEFEFTPRHRVTALVYEFAKPSADDDPVVSASPTADAGVHLAPIIEAFERVGEELSPGRP